MSYFHVHKSLTLITTIIVFIKIVLPSMRVIAFKQTTPALQGNFVASSASVIGQVSMGANSSVWYGAVLRGDVNTITIGSSVTISDRVMVHCSGIARNAPVVIGNNVVVKAGAIVHGCTIADGAVIGEGAQVMDGAKVGKNALISPGSIVKEDAVIPAGQVWGGVPATYLRDLSTLEIEEMHKDAAENVDWAAVHAKEDNKSWEQIEDEEYDHDQEVNRSPYYYKRLTPEQMEFKVGEVESHMVPGRILDSNVSARTHKESRPFGSGGEA